MIFQRLIEYYDRLAADRQNAQELALVGFSRESISFCLVLKCDGSIDLQDIREGKGGKGPIASKMEVPHYGEKRTVNERPYFLWDNTEYVFGIGKAGEQSSRSLRRFELFKDFHCSLRQALCTPEYELFCDFLENWTPSKFNALKYGSEALGKNIVFKMAGQSRYLHEIEECLDVWAKLISKKETVQGQSLISGLTTGIARLHPAIKGVYDPGGQAEKGFVVFNKDKTAFESYGNEQSYNAPVGVVEAAKYANALNYLLGRPDRRTVVGDATYTYWADKPTLLENFFDPAFGDSPPPKPDAPPEVKERALQVRQFLEQLREGHAHGDAFDRDSDVGFYVLGLSPNASRLSVRFWQQTTVGELEARLAQHLQDMHLVGARPDDPPLVIRRIVEATGRAKVSDGRFQGYDADTVSPVLAGAVARAIFTGGPYPSMLLGAMLNRLRADGYVSHARVAAIKVVLVRGDRNHYSMKEALVALDLNRTDPAYVTGRLFALLERIQEDAANGQLNSTIKDRYFSAASATPGSTFPRLIRLSQHHLSSLGKEKPGLKVNHDKLCGEIMGKLDGFATQFNLEDQGLFAVGYYHQRQAFYTPQNKEEGDAQ
ncbi:MAG: type I-C CRISPR-associated protein Cas8c/Csd1 [Tepidisphaeraceae bacterium]